MPRCSGNSWSHFLQTRPKQNPQTREIQFSNALPGDSLRMLPATQPQQVPRAPLADFLAAYNTRVLLNLPIDLTLQHAYRKVWTSVREDFILKTCMAQLNFPAGAVERRPILCVTFLADLRSLLAMQRRENYNPCPLSTSSRTSTGKLKSCA